MVKGRIGTARKPISILLMEFCRSAKSVGEGESALESTTQEILRTCFGNEGEWGKVEFMKVESGENCYRVV